MLKLLHSGASWRMSTVLVLAALAGCAYVPGRSALIERVQPLGEEAHYVVSLLAPTGNFGVSGHALGAYREVQWVSVRLPENPQGESQYQASQVAVTEESYPPKPIAVVSGTVRVDRHRAQVYVALQTASGPLWANGVYPIRER